jgi:tripartite-type tricarboxylate transporter receptor subunit TctC
MKLIPLFLALSVTTFASPLAYPQAYPEKPVRVVVPYVAGQGVDITMRVVTEKLSRELGKEFVVENKSGAAGNLGTQFVKQAPPDGYTLLACTNATHAANRALYPTSGIVPDADFVPVALTGMFPMVVAVSGDSALNNLQDLVGAARAKPDTINVALPHTTARVVFELLRSEAKAPLFGVLYRGLPLADIVTDRIQVLVDTVAATRSLIEAGKLKALAVTTAEPSPLLPGVKTVAQQGVPGFEIVAWTALCAPKATPPAVVDTLERATQRVMGMPETRERLMQLAVDPRTMGATEFGNFMKSETQKWGETIRSANITAE